MGSQVRRPSSMGPQTLTASTICGFSLFKIFYLTFLIQNLIVINKIILTLWNQNIKRLYFIETYNFLSYLF